MEYGGVTLHRALAQTGPLGLESARSVALQLKAALEAIHQIKIIHLDVKPGNVLWCEELLQLKLVDFGMSERCHSSPCGSAVDRLLGSANACNSLRFTRYVTEAYRPPELWSCTADDMLQAISPAVDMWSWSCTIYESVTGRALMKPSKHSGARTSVERMVQTWCSFCAAEQPHKGKGTTRPHEKHYEFRMRLLRAGAWKDALLYGLRPERSSRAWPSVSKLPV